MIFGKIIVLSWKRSCSWRTVHINNLGNRQSMEGRNYVSYVHDSENNSPICSRMRQSCSAGWLLLGFFLLLFILNILCLCLKFFCFDMCNDDLMLEKVQQLQRNPFQIWFKIESLFCGNKFGFQNVLANV